jgi:hypothetical protein
MIYHLWSAHLDSEDKECNLGQCVRNTPQVGPFWVRHSSLFFSDIVATEGRLLRFDVWSHGLKCNGNVRQELIKSQKTDDK